MRKLNLIVFIMGMLLITALVYADRNNSSYSCITSDTSIKNGTGILYRVSFLATSDDATFGLYDTTGGGTANTTTVRTEGGEGVATTGKSYSYIDRPIPFIDGLYAVVNGGTLIVEYE